MRKIFFLLVLGALICDLKAQTYPPDNPVYQLVWGDEFDGNITYNIVDNESRHETSPGVFEPINEPLQTKVDINKWRHNNFGNFPPTYEKFKSEYGCYAGLTNVWSILDQYSTYETWFYRNVEVNNGICSLLVKQEQAEQYCWDGFVSNGQGGYNIVEKMGLFNCTKGSLYSKQKFKYGYFEIRMRVPQPPAGQENKIKGGGVCFWMWNAEGNSCSSTVSKNSEIDIYEMFNWNKTYMDNYNSSVLLNEWTRNVHYDDCNNKDWDYGNPLVNQIQTRRSVDFTNNQFHTFGLNWTPDKLQWFIDGVMVVEEEFIPSDNYPQLKPSELVAMPFRIDINFPNLTICDPDGLPSSNFQFPYIYEIDYVRVFQPKVNCQAQVQLCDNNFSSFLSVPEQIYQTYSLAGTCNLTTNNTQNMHLTASDEIMMNENTLIETDMTLDIIPICEPENTVFNTWGKAPNILTDKQLWEYYLKHQIRTR